MTSTPSACGWNTHKVAEQWLEQGVQRKRERVKEREREKKQQKKTLPNWLQCRLCDIILLAQWIFLFFSEKKIPIFLLDISSNNNLHHGPYYISHVSVHSFTFSQGWVGGKKNTVKQLLYSNHARGAHYSVAQAMRNRRSSSPSHHGQ